MAVKESTSYRTDTLTVNPITNSDSFVITDCNGDTFEMSMEEAEDLFEILKRILSNSKGTPVSLL